MIYYRSCTLDRVEDTTFSDENSVTKTFGKQTPRVSHSVCLFDSVEIALV